MDLVSLQKVELRENKISSFCNLNICENNLNKEEYDFAKTLICFTFSC